MPIFSAINFILVISLITIQAFGIVLILRHQQQSIYRRFLITMLSFWVVIMSALAIRFYANGFTLHLNNGVANIRTLLLGLPCFFSLNSFPAAILNARLIKIRNWIRLLSPMILMLAIYFGWHLISGDDPFAKYSSAEFWHNLTNPTVFLRLSIVAMFIGYIVILQLSIWQVAPIYNEYVNEHLSDCSYDVSWVRRLILHTTAVSVAYFALVFTNLLWVNTIYLLTVISLFGFIIDHSLCHRTLEGLPPIMIKWSLKNRWNLFLEGEEKSPTGDKVSAQQIYQSRIQIDKWMDETEKYIDVNFTTNDILESFPDLTHEKLTAIFKSNGENFQSYVRRFRIKKACEIMNNNSGDVITKQLFGAVGFSHYSSFSRSFVTVMGKSPSEYLSLTKDNPQPIDIQGFTPPYTKN